MKPATLALIAGLTLTFAFTSCSKDPIQEDLISLQMKPNGFAEMAEDSLDHTAMTRVNGHIDEDGIEEIEPDGTDMTRPDGYEDPNAPVEWKTPAPVKL